MTGLREHRAGRLSFATCYPPAAMTTIAFLGDIFGAPGRQIVAQQLPVLRDEHAPDVIIANAENVARGSGLTPAQYRQLRELGIDGITLGDHVYRHEKITDVMARPDEPISRPANLPPAAPGRQVLRVPLPGTDRSVFVITVLGRVFMNLPIDDPFATVDRLIAGLPEPDPIVIVEVHMEATSEKAAMAHHLDGRVAAVVGTHTHVPTADARVLPGGTAFITDLGMCGPFDSCIGRSKRDVVRHLTTGQYVPFGIGEGDERMCGAVIRVGADARAVDILSIMYRNAGSA